jgi:hypothetical protein
MPVKAEGISIRAMNRPSSKIMLIADRRDAGAARGAVAVRRFRLARLRQDDAAATVPSRARLKQG